MTTYNETIRLFGFGSLMNEKALQERAPQACRVRWAKLKGYEAIFTKIGSHHVYLTIAKKDGRNVFGALIDVDPAGLEILKAHEPGYSLIGLTPSVCETDGSPYREALPVYSFVAPVPRYIPEQLRTIRRSYIDKSMAELPPEIRERWLEDWVRIPGGIVIDDGA
jgi:hypothetical protein